MIPLTSVTKLRISCSRASLESICSDITALQTYSDLESHNKVRWCCFHHAAFQWYFGVLCNCHLESNNMRSLLEKILTYLQFESVSSNNTLVSNGLLALVAGPFPDG